MGVQDGFPVSASYTNPRFISKNTPDVMPFPLGFTGSGPTIADIQAAVNKLYTATGASESTTGTVYNATPGTVANGDTYEDSITILANKFDSATGHKHTGTAGDAPVLDVVLTAAVSGTGGTPVFGNITFESGTGMTINQIGNNFIFNSAAGTTLAASGYTQLSGAVVLSAGTGGGIAITQSGQNIIFDVDAIPAAEGSGLKNYLSTVNGVNGNGNFELGTTTKWSLFNTTLTGVIPTGSISAGAASITTFSVTNVNPLAGTYSLNIAGSGAITAGQGFITDAFTLDSEDLAKVMQLKFYYSILSGVTNLNFSGTSSNSWAMYIYDVTNSQWMQPAGVYNLVQNSGGAGICNGTVQTQINSSVYRLAIVCINSTAGASSMLFDDFFFGPQITAAGAAVSNWNAYSLVIGATTTAPTLGTTSINSAFWRRVGDSIEIKYDVSAAAGSSGSGTYLFPLPSGYSIDTQKITLSTNGQNSVVGAGSSFSSAGSELAMSGFVVAYDSTNLALVTGNDLNSVAFVGGTRNSAGNGIRYSFEAVIPVVGWSAQTVMSNDTDTRVVEASYAMTSNFSVTTSLAVVKFDTKITDTHAAYSPSTGLYTIPVTGIYRISSQFASAAQTVATTALAAQITAYKNGSAYRNLNIILGNAGAGNNYWCGGDTEIPCVAGDTLAIFGRVGTTGDIVGTADNYITISRISGPATIAATDSVNARYYGSTTTVSSSISIVINPTKSFDSNGAYNPSTGRYTIPVSGKYAVAGFIQGTNFSMSTSDSIQIYFYKNGTSYQVGTGGITYGNGTTEYYGVGSSDLIDCIAGDIIDMRCYSATTNNVNVSYFSIYRVGN